MALPVKGSVQPVTQVDPSSGEQIGASAPAFRTGHKDVAAAGTGVQLHADLAPFAGKAVTIKAKHTNTDVVYIGRSKAESEDAAVRFTLQKNEKLNLAIANLNLVWVNSAINGEGVEWAVETAS